MFAGGRANLSDVLIAECQTTGDQEHGGGIYMQDGTLTMTGGAIRDCKALKGGKFTKSIESVTGTVQAGYVAACSDGKTRALSLTKTTVKLGKVLTQSRK